MRHSHLGVGYERRNPAVLIFIQGKDPLLVAHHPRTRVDAEYPRLPLCE